MINHKRINGGIKDREAAGGGVGGWGWSRVEGVEAGGGRREI